MCYKTSKFCLPCELFVTEEKSSQVTDVLHDKLSISRMKRYFTALELI